MDVLFTFRQWRGRVLTDSSIGSRCSMEQSIRDEKKGTSKMRDTQCRLDRGRGSATDKPIAMYLVMVMALAVSGAFATPLSNLPAVQPSFRHKQISNESSCSDILAWSPIEAHPAVVVQVVSRDYLLLEKNFLHYMEERSSLSRDNLYLMCLDVESHDFFGALGVRCVDAIKHYEDEVQVWGLRVRVLSCLHGAGNNVLLSDADAIWLRDPIVDIHEQGITADIVTQRGKYPFDLSARWGVTMCMGFALFRGGGDGMHVFLDHFQEAFRSSGDDQIALNVAAAHLGITWDYSTDMGFIESTAVGTGVIQNISGQDVTVALLPHSAFIRMCADGPLPQNVVVAHCFYAKTILNRHQQWMASKHVWFGADSDDHEQGASST